MKKVSLAGILLATTGTALATYWIYRRLDLDLAERQPADRPWSSNAIPSPPENATSRELLGYLACAAKRSLELESRSLELESKRLGS